MTVLVVDQLEMVKVHKDNAEFRVEATRTLELDLQGRMEVAGVEESRAVVGDGEFLDAFERAGVFDGNPGVVGEDMQERSSRSR